MNLIGYITPDNVEAERNKIIEIIVKTGIGSIVVVIIGMIFQYFISKKLIIF